MTFEAWKKQVLAIAPMDLIDPAEAAEAYVEGRPPAAYAKEVLAAEPLAAKALRDAAGAASTLALAASTLEQALAIPIDSDAASKAAAADKARKIMDVIGNGILDVSAALRKLADEAADGA